MRRINPTWLCPLVGALWLLFGFCPDARAGKRFGRVTLDLQEGSAEVPTHLCVVSAAPSQRARKRLWDVLASSPDLIPTPGGGTSKSWRVNSAVWNGDGTAVDRARCADNALADCRPRVELPSALARQTDLYVACTADSLTEGGAPSDPKPLFVLLEFLEGSPPQIESVRLVGGVASIGVFGVSVDQVVVTARSLGGHYLPHQRSQRGESEPLGRDSKAQGPRRTTIRLDLQPRCRQVEVRLPRTRVAPSDRSRLSVRVHGITIDVDKCVNNLTGSEVLQIRVPPAPRRVGTIDVALAATPQGAPSARFGGSYEGSWPKTPFTLSLNQVSFDWRRPECIYPKNACPRAQLETGTSCSGQLLPETGAKPGICRYTCPGAFSEQGAVDLELPLGVTFEKDNPKQTWSDTLAKNGQELASFVPDDKVYLVANVNDWETRIPDNQINGVQIFGEDGQARRYGVTKVDRLLLPIPGSTLRAGGRICENIRFKMLGDRSHEEAMATVSEGKLDFGNPQRSARVASFNMSLLIGGGPGWTGSDPTPPVYFSALGMLALQLRPRAHAWNRLAFELRAGGTLGRWGRKEEGGGDDEGPRRSFDGLMPEAKARAEAKADAAAADADAASPTEKRLGWARVLFEPGIVVSLHSRVAMGMGLGIGFSLPFRDATEITGSEFNFISSPNLDFRLRLLNRLRFMVQFRGIFGEERFTTSREDTQDAEKSDREAARSLLILFGLQAVF